MELKLKLVNGQVQTIDIDIETSIEVTLPSGNKTEISGITRLTDELSVYNATEPIEKVLIAEDTPKAKIKEFRDAIPAQIKMALSKDLHYTGQSRTVDTYARIVELSPKASKEQHDAMYAQFKQITALMDEMNVIFKDCKPTNATRAGKIHYHFPSAQFPETSKN